MKAVVKSERKNFTALSHFMHQIILAMESDELVLADMAKIAMLKKLAEKWRPTLNYTTGTVGRYSLDETGIFTLQLVTEIAKYTPSATLEKIILYEFNTQINTQLL
jgi:hypothetical protein